MNVGVPRLGGHAPPVASSTTRRRSTVHVAPRQAPPSTRATPGRRHERRCPTARWPRPTVASSTTRRRSTVHVAPRQAPPSTRAAPGRRHEGHGPPSPRPRHDAAAPSAWPLAELRTPADDHDGAEAVPPSVPSGTTRTPSSPPASWPSRGVAWCRPCTRSPPLARPSRASSRSASPTTRAGRGWRAGSTGRCHPGRCTTSACNGCACPSRGGSNTGCDDAAEAHPGVTVDRNPTSRLVLLSELPPIGSPKGLRGRHHRCDEMRRGPNAQGVRVTQRPLPPS